MVISTLNPLVKLELTNDAIVLHKGIIGRTKRKVLYSKINSVVVRKKPFINYGSVVVFAGNDTSGWKSPTLNDPEKLEQLISEKIKQAESTGGSDG